MFRFNPAANYQPNGGRYLQILSGKDLYEQTIVVSSKDTFPARFPNIFVDYPLGQMHIGDKWWTNWNKAPMQLWQTQLNFPNCITAVMDETRDYLADLISCKRAIFKYEGFPKVP